MASIAAGAKRAVADVEFGRGNPRLHVDIVQAVEVDRRVAPGLRRRLPVLPGDVASVEPLEIEVELHQRLARQIDRGPAVERAVAERAGDAVDHHDRAVEPDFGLGRQRRLQQAGRVELDFGRDVLPLDRRRPAAPP